MSQNVIQTSFAAGELSPNLYAHVDLAKYHTGVALARNFFVDYRGGLSTRPGLEFITQCLKSSTEVRLIGFQFSVIQTYILEFGDQYIRIIKDGAPVLEAAKTVVGITLASPGVLNVAAHGFSSGDWVYVLAAGMTQINQVTGVVVVVDANNFSLLDPLTGIGINTTAYSAFTSGTASRVYTLTSPYLSTDLSTLKFTQSADTMTITHSGYVPRNLTRTGHAAWTLSTITIGSTQVAPAGLAGVATAGGATDYKYVVTAVNANGEESVASNVADVPAAINIAVTAGSISLTWSAATGAVSYNVYKAQPAVGNTIPAGVNFGFIGNATGLAFVDGNIVPDFVRTPPLNTNPLTSNNPATVGYFQQRRVYAGSDSYPETMWLSQPGSFNNFDVTNPVADDNAITATLISNQVNNIKHMVAMPGGLVVLTGGGAWQVSGGGSNAPITPRDVTATPQAYNGCSDVPPIVINYDILYNQARGSVVRDLSYSFYTNIYTGADISVLSNHLLIGRSIAGWAYAEDPFKIIWSVTSDGELLSLTYLKEQEVIGWAHHDTLGVFKSDASIPEGNTSAVYVVAERIVKGATVKYIERFTDRLFPYGSEDAFCVDSGLTNSLTYPAATVTASAASGNGVTFSASAAVFTSGDVGKILRMGGGIATITAFNNSSQLIGNITRDISSTYPNSNSVPFPAASGDWSLTSQFTTFSGLQHLAGQTVKMFGDGNVFPDQTVTDAGAVTFSQPVSKAVVGLGYQCQIQTLYLDVGEPTIAAKRKKIAALTTRVHQTRGLKMGSTFNTLTEYKMRSDQPMGQPIELFTGDQRITLDPSWNVYGQICIQQDYPLPATVLGVVPEIVVGDTSK